MKYILLENMDGRHIPIMFPDSLTHIDMKEAVCRSRRLVDGPTRVVSAGFVGLTGVTTSGYSESLDVQSRDVDAGYIMGGDAVAFMPSPIVGNLVARMRKQEAKRPKARVELTSKQSPEPVNTHGGLAVATYWELAVEGVVIAKDSDRRNWETNAKKRARWGNMEFAPPHMKELYDQLCKAIDPVGPGQ